MFIFWKFPVGSGGHGWSQNIRHRGQGPWQDVHLAVYILFPLSLPPYVDLFISLSAFFFFFNKLVELAYIIFIKS